MYLPSWSARVRPPLVVTAPCVNVQNNVVYAYENALSEPLTKLDAVESYAFKDVREARKELVVQIKRGSVELEKKVIQALGAGEEEEKVEKKVEELIE